MAREPGRGDGRVEHAREGVGVVDAFVDLHPELRFVAPDTAATVDAGGAPDAFEHGIRRFGSRAIGGVGDAVVDVQMDRHGQTAGGGWIAQTSDTVPVAVRSAPLAASTSRTASATNPPSGAAAMRRTVPPD